MTFLIVLGVPLRFSAEELAALDDFFNGSGEMKDADYDPLARRFRYAAVKAGLYDEEL